MASLASLNLANCNGINIQDINLTKATLQGFGVSVSDSSNIRISGLHVQGTGDLATAGTGILLKNSSNVVVQNSTFDHLMGGISFTQSNNVTFLSNQFTHIVSDGIVGSSTSNLVVKDNFFTNFNHFGPSHPDCIQLFTAAGDPISRNILIDGNVYNRGSGTAVQGIWVKNDTGQAPFENVSITNNTILGSEGNGIGVINVGTAVVNGNTLIAYDDQQTSFNISGTRGSVLVQNNTASTMASTDTNAYYVNNTIASKIPLASVPQISGMISDMSGQLKQALSWAVQSALSPSLSTLSATNFLSGQAAPGQLGVTATVAQILSHSDIASSTKVQIVGNNVIDIATANRLSDAHLKLSLATDSKVTVTGTALQMLDNANYAGLHQKVVTDYLVTGNSTLNTSQAVKLTAFDHMTLDAQASVTVVDWANNVSKYFGVLESLASDGNLTGITLIDTSPIKLTDSQYAEGSGVLALVSGAYSVNVVAASGHVVVAQDSHATIDGGAGNVEIHASADGNTMVGGVGDSLFGGAGADKFVFHGHSGAETVNNFDAALDIVQFDRAVISDWKKLQPAMHQDGDNVTISLGGSDTITLTHTAIADLHASNFKFF